MSRITQVTIKGFQSHINSTFKLAPGLTVITGPSDAGKTAVIRGIRWVAFNEPQGEGFLFTVRNNAGEIEKQAEFAEVTIEFDNGVSITKTRRKGKTSYKHSAFAEPWEKAEVPQEIKEALGLYKQSYGENFETCLNFAYQLEAPFILSETPSVGAKILGKLAGTEVVDKAIAAISKNTYKTREEVRQADKTINELNIELLDYMGVDDLKQQVNTCEALLESIEEKAKQSDLLTVNYGSYLLVVHGIEAVNKKLEVLAVVPGLVTNLAATEKNQQRYEGLVSLQKLLNQYVSLITECNMQIDKYKEIDGATILMRTVETSSNRLTIIKDLSSLYIKYSQTIITASDTLDKTKDTDQAATALRVLETTVTRLDTLKQLNSQYISFNYTAQAKVEYLKKFTSFEEVSELLGKAIQNAERLVQLQQLKTEYSKKDTGVKQAVQALKDSEADYWKANDELKQAWEAAGDICPLCEQPVNKGV